MSKSRYRYIVDRNRHSFMFPDYLDLEALITRRLINRNAPKVKKNEVVIKPKSPPVQRNKNGKQTNVKSVLKQKPIMYGAKYPQQGIFKTVSFDEEKDYYLSFFLEHYPDRSIIFVGNHDRALRLINLLTLLKWRLCPLLLTMTDREILRAVAKFNKGSTGVIITTDEVASTLTMKPDVKHLIHYDIPKTYVSYEIRTNSLAINSSGITLLLMDENEMNDYLESCRLQNKNDNIPLFPLKENEWAILKNKIDIAKDILRREAIEGR